MGRGTTGELEINIDGNGMLEVLPDVVRQLQETLRQAPAGVRLTIAAGEVGLALIQLLCSAHRSAQRLDKTLAVSWQNPEPVAALLRDAGFTRHVPCPRSRTGDCLWLTPHWS